MTVTKTKLNELIGLKLSDSLYNFLTKEMNTVDRVRVFTSYQCKGITYSRMYHQKAYNITNAIKYIKRYTPIYSREPVWLKHRDEIINKLKEYKNEKTKK